MVSFQVTNFSNPSIYGALVGCLLTTITYVVFSSRESLWDTKDGDLIRSDKGLIYERSSILDQLYESDHLSDPLTPHKKGSRSLNHKHGSRKSVLLSVVAISVDQIDRMPVLIEQTWGQGVEGWRVAVGTNGTEKAINEEDKDLFLAGECKDFTTGESYMNAEKLFCLLRAIHDKYISSYKWFILVTDTVYVSMDGMERFLMTLDPDESVYIGKPDDNNYCDGRAGLLFSQAALYRIVPHLEACLQASVNLSVTGDIVLGACFANKLLQTCHSFNQYSIERSETLSPKSSEFESYYKDHFVVYPADLSLMKELHTLHQTREMDYHIQRATDYKNRLFKSSICNVQPVDVDVPLPQDSSEVETWSVVNPNSSYYSGRLEPREWYDGELRMEMDSLMKRGLNIINITRNYYPKSPRVMYGLFRYRGTRGREVILDVETKNKTKKQLHRIHLINPHQPKPVLLEDSGPEAINKTIDFVVPLSNVKSRFVEFMKIYENLCLSVNEKCRLNLVVYGNKDIEIIKSSLNEYRKKYPAAQFNVIPGVGEFSRGRALHTGISTLQKSDLAFTCDVDMTIERSFLNRCRRNALQGRRVYYPQVFKYYNMDYVYRFRDRPTDGYRVSRNHGHWCTYGYGMLCVYKSDYDTVGGYDSTIEGWGGEDIQLSDKIIQWGLEVMRAPDPSLLHRYHPKVCSRKLTKSQYYQCVTSRNEDIADRRRLADYIFYLENKCHIQKKKWD